MRSKHPYALTSIRIQTIAVRISLPELDLSLIHICRQIASWYDAAFADIAYVKPLAVRSNAVHAYHLYVVLFDLGQLNCTRADLYAALRAENIGVNVHYIPVHLHPYYRERFGTDRGLCPVAEDAYDRLVTLPIFPEMTEADADDVITAIRKLEELKHV